MVYVYEYTSLWVTRYLISELEKGLVNVINLILLDLLKKIRNSFSFSALLQPEYWLKFWIILYLSRVIFSSTILNKHLTHAIGLPNCKILNKIKKN